MGFRMRFELGPEESDPGRAGRSALPVLSCSVTIAPYKVPRSGVPTLSPKGARDFSGTS
jgi:hypothetical protein